MPFKKLGQYKQGKLSKSIFSNRVEYLTHSFYSSMPQTEYHYYSNKFRSWKKCGSVFVEGCKKKKIPYDTNVIRYHNATSFSSSVIYIYIYIDVLIYIYIYMYISI